MLSNCLQYPSPPNSPVNNDFTDDPRVIVSYQRPMPNELLNAINNVELRKITQPKQETKAPPVDPLVAAINKRRAKIKGREEVVTNYEAKDPLQEALNNYKDPLEKALANLGCSDNQVEPESTASPDLEGTTNLDTETESEDFVDAAEDHPGHDSLLMALQNHAAMKKAAKSDERILSIETDLEAVIENLSAEREGIDMTIVNTTS